MDTSCFSASRLSSRLASTPPGPRRSIKKLRRVGIAAVLQQRPNFLASAHDQQRHGHVHLLLRNFVFRVCLRLLGQTLLQPGHGFRDLRRQAAIDAGQHSDFRASAFVGHDEAGQRRQQRFGHGLEGRGPLAISNGFWATNLVTTSGLNLSQSGLSASWPASAAAARKRCSWLLAGFFSNAHQLCDQVLLVLGQGGANHHHFVRVALEQALFR